MLTPQEVAERSFAKASFNGYNMAQVDDFLDEITRDYETLFNDNTLLKQKLAVLSGKIKEYQSTEEAMRKTLLTAQTMADEMIREAEGKRDGILREAEADVRARIDTLEAEEQAQRERLYTAGEATERFVAQVRESLAQQAEMLEALNRIVPQPRPKAEPDPLSAISDEVSQALNQDTSEDGGDTVEFAVPDADLPEGRQAGNDKGDRRATLFADLGNNFGREVELK